ncbi:apolipoprotein N-acyltransferase [Limibaculum sp. M0105]|uniref:Apolipoprotein N-acyltransferase n=1 Tax=Thermohalobaculum xanthum TaxID=2753746 RepID=A0A8J7MAW0_9RHOB|nr:apolipoprotein N-acyltransferase [Thermohalobaculum xanthum]MBK0400908.1 apolipoprotein N-acyltransferase [Thermohalobaculum xanthum]
MRDSTPDAATPPLVGRIAAAVARLRGWQRMLAAFVAGMALTGGQAPVSAPGLWFLAMPVLVWLVDGTARPRQAAAVGWAAGFGMFVTGLFWIGHAFLVDAEQFAWMLPFAVTLLPAGLGLFWAAAFWFARRGWIEGSLWRVALLAAAISLAEFARSTLLTGLPWGLAAFIWTETPVAQAASVIGPHGLSLLTYAATALPLVAIAGVRRGPGPVVTVLVLGIIPALWAWGAARVPDATSYAPDAPVLRVVQPNATQRLKWNPDYAALFYRRLLDATAAPADPALGPPDAVIWPETAVTFLPAERPEERARIAAAAGGAPVILGALNRQQRGERTDWTNSLMTITPDAAIGGRYDKAHLVPFGEYVPLQPILRHVGIRQLADRGGFLPGPGARNVEVAPLPPFRPLICYEAIFPHEILPEGARPGWLLQVTNDGWFGNFGGPQQHLAQARFRAIEQGLPFVRAANTGISAVIDPHGRVLVSLALGDEGAFDHRLPAPLAPTVYAVTGDATALAAVLFLIFAARLRRRRGA